MRNVILLTLYILIGNISGTSLYANNSIKLHASHISINKGMHQSTIHTMYQDEFGMIWFGTKRGLVRYDGTQMKFIQNFIMTFLMQKSWYVPLRGIKMAIFI